MAEDTKIESPYKMQLDLRVLDHLGLRLYSNAAAVLSEAVANAWDADAHTVKIEINADKIVIKDDGVGMSLNDINDRFLYVGYDKRKKEGASSPNGRPFMGRKGIGKLALFSIADTIRVTTKKNDEVHSFEMSTTGVRQAVEEHEVYKPIPVTSEEDIDGGTLIELTNLTKKRVAQTVLALRKRIARRFSVIGYAGTDFKVIINGTEINADDKEDLKVTEFLWEFGEASIPEGHCPKLVKRFTLNNQVSEDNPEWTVNGWIGAVARPKHLAADDGTSINSIVVIARGRLIQENILDKLAVSTIAVSYLTGQIQADFLDTEDQDDIATSDRQRLMEDDPRYIALIRFLKRNISSLSDTWTKERNEKRGEEAVEEQPLLQAWLDRLTPEQKKAAKRTIGVIKSVELDDENDRVKLYRAGVLAFERLRLVEASHVLGDMGHLTAATLLPLLADWETLEASMYRDIVKTRLEVIKAFEGLIDANERERVLQQKLFENLWLLDPGWERATGSERLEQSLKREYDIFSPNLTPLESKGRIDIRYRKNADQHIIVELKKSDRVLTVEELIQQGKKYYSGLKKCLLQAEQNPNPSIAIIFVLGKVISDEADMGIDFVNNILKPINGRVVYYEQLISSARNAYAQYISASDDLSGIETIIGGLIAR